MPFSKNSLYISAPGPAWADVGKVRASVKASAATKLQTRLAMFGAKIFWVI